MLTTVLSRDLLPVDTGDVKGDQEVLEHNKHIILIVPFYFSKFINTKSWVSQSFNYVAWSVFFSVNTKSARLQEAKLHSWAEL